MTEKPMEIGKTYKIDHTRKGQFIVAVLSIDDEWVTGLVVQGITKAIMDYNVKEEGEQVTMRRSFIRSFIEVIKK